MKKVIAAAIIAATLTGCAATAYKQARANTNQIKNGMTLAEVTQILGMPPTSNSPTIAFWKRGNAQQYDGTSRGAIRVEFQDGKVVNVPEGGLFSDAAASGVAAAERKALDAYNASLDKEKLRKQEEQTRLNEEAEQKRAADEAAAKREIAAEVVAASQASYSCNDKLTCSKVFALAQIYVAQNSDQKIQVATDTIIQTYNPTDSGNIGMSVIKTPKQGTLEVITVTPVCKDNKDGIFASFCRKARTRIYAGFRPFVDSQLAK